MNSQVIVSCTTTKNRLFLLYYMLKSIKKQTLKPDILYVNLSSKEDLIPAIHEFVPDLLKLDFVKINWTEDIGSYRKLLPIIDKIKDDENFVVTADDDILYGNNWLEKLVEMGKKYPKHIVCARARNMKKKLFGKWEKYSKWELIEEARAGMNILPNGGAGAVYRKNLLDIEFLKDPAFRKIASTSDDLWFRMASLRKGTPVYVFPEINSESIYLNHRLGLENINIKKYKKSFFTKINKKTLGRIKEWMRIDQSLNDKSWHQILEYSRRNN